MKSLPIIGAGALALAAIAACGPPPGEPQIGQPGYCGQTADGSAVVALVQDLTRCQAKLGQKQIGVAELCGPIMPGSLAADDCYRGSIPGIPSPDNFRYGTIIAKGGQVINLVASDATAP